jgi:polyhydroxyalkanoate synthase
MTTPWMERLLDRGAELNDRAAATVANGFDWLFRHDKLVKSGQTSFELIYTSDLMTVRYYALVTEDDIQLNDGSLLPIQRPQHAVPLVLVPPLGVTVETFDLMPKRSLVRYMAARGFKTYLICWGTPQRRHAKLGMKDYADRMMGEALDAVRAHSQQQQVSLMGWCMGGLLALLHAGLQPEGRIRNIVTVASPIDMRGGGLVAGVAQIVNKPAKLIRKYTDLRLNMLKPELFHTPGFVTTIVFKLTDPIASVTTYWDLITNLWDREFVESHTTTSDYLNNMLTYPAGVVADMLVKVVVDNSLAQGEFVLGRKVSRFARIQAPIFVFAGASDALISASTAEGILDLVGSTDKRFEVAPGGHMGVILGATAQNAVWRKSADWLVKRSAADVKTRVRRTRVQAPDKRSAL